MYQSAQEHFFYLRRRIEDFPDEGAPVPRWTAMDYQAVQSVLHQLGVLQRFYQSVQPQLQKHGNQPAISAEEAEEYGSVYDLTLKQSKARASAPGPILFSTGLLLGLFARELWMTLV